MYIWKRVSCVVGCVIISVLYVVDLALLPSSWALKDFLFVSHWVSFVQSVHVRSLQCGQEQFAVSSRVYVDQHLNRKLMFPSQIYFRLDSFEHHSCGQFQNWGFLFKRSPLLSCHTLALELTSNSGLLLQSPHAPITFGYPSPQFGYLGTWSYPSALLRLLSDSALTWSCPFRCHTCRTLGIP